MKDTTIIRYGERDVATLHNQFADLRVIMHPLQMADPCKLIGAMEDTARYLKTIKAKYPEGTMGWLLTSILPNVLGPDITDTIIHLWRKTCDDASHVGAFDRLDSFVSVRGFIAVPIVLMTTFSRNEDDDSFTRSQKDTIESVLWSVYKIEDGPLSKLTCPPF